jgi:hypothetical protein
LRLVPEFTPGFTPHDPEPFDLASIDLTASIPLGSYFSIAASGFGSSLFGRPELPPGISAFDFENLQRIYFPHAAGIFSGEKRAALALALHFEPWKNLSILGGRLIFSLAASAGRAGSFEWNEWGDFVKNDLVWNTSLGAALVPVRNFGLQIRAGAGGGGGRQPAPFISLDMGMSAFQKRLF